MDIRGAVRKKEFYLVPEEIFRLGNSSGPRLSNVRPRDVNPNVA
jgi:hypothetical protein